MNFRRYGIYHLPVESEEWARFATRWLGWDACAGVTPVPLAAAPAEEVVRTPRRYGLHATLKPPFHLAEGKTAEALSEAVEALAGRLAPVRLDGLGLARIGRFLALRPVGDETALNALAAECVRAPDAFRAPPDAEELARRRQRRLSAAQEENLMAWGYPHVMDLFRFHITLSGPLAPERLTETEAGLALDLGPLLPSPYVIGDIALVGEGEDNRFRLISRHPLRGA